MTTPETRRKVHQVVKPQTFDSPRESSTEGCLPFWSGSASGAQAASLLPPSSRLSTLMPCWPPPTTRLHPWLRPPPASSTGRTCTCLPEHRCVSFRSLQFPERVPPFQIMLRRVRAVPPACRHHGPHLRQLLCLYRQQFCLSSPGRYTLLCDHFGTPKSPAYSQINLRVRLLLAPGQKHPHNVAPPPPTHTHIPPPTLIHDAST